MHNDSETEETVARPPKPHTSEGNLRRVGVELEFTGIDLPQTAECIQQLYGGDIEAQSRYELTVRGTSLGDFRVEFDTTLLKDARYQKILQRCGIRAGPDARNAIEKWLRRLLEPIVPCEIVASPIPFTELPELDRLVKALQRRGGRGTKESPQYAFGLHFNVEVSANEVRETLAVLRAFLTLGNTMKKAHGVDHSRRAARMVADFPETYRRIVLARGYKPNAEDFLEDYLEYNASRERPLDLLPLLATWDKQRVAEAMEESHLLAARPTFHYRYPNSGLCEHDWTLCAEWKRWVEIERLAHAHSHHHAAQRVREELLGKGAA